MVKVMAVNETHINKLVRWWKFRDEQDFKVPISHSLARSLVGPSMHRKYIYFFRSLQSICLSNQNLLPRDHNDDDDNEMIGANRIVANFLLTSIGCRILVSVLCYVLCTNDIIFIVQRLQERSRERWKKLRGTHCTRFIRNFLFAQDLSNCLHTFFVGILGARDFVAVYSLSLSLPCTLSPQ